MKNKKRKAFTLVELLAVIVILAVILVIAIPQIMNTIKTARLSSIKDSAMLIAEQADKDYLSNQVLNQDYSSTSIPCSDVAKLNDDYESCKIIYNDGVAKVILNGKDGGKFSGITCTGTKDNMNCKEKDIPNKIDAVEYLTTLIDEETISNGCDGTGKLIKVTHENGDVDYRYVGSCPNNYVTFNDETWRIVGIFDTQKTVGGTKEKRIKLIRNESLENYSWDSSASSVNSVYGVNEWSQADLKTELNGDYLNSSLSSNTTWYNGRSNAKTATFDKSKVLKSSAQSLIDDSVWYLGASTYGVSLSEQYSNERGNATGKICASGTNCNDSVDRTTKWVGKVGLIYPSDYGYASEDSVCATNLGYIDGATDPYPCKNKNWLFTGNNYWTITPLSHSSNALYVEGVGDDGDVYSTYAYRTLWVRPSINLVSDILISGEGTVESPFTFSK